MTDETRKVAGAKIGDKRDRMSEERALLEATINDLEDLDLQILGRIRALPPGSYVRRLLDGVSDGLWRVRFKDRILRDHVLRETLFGLGARYPEDAPVEASNEGRNWITVSPEDEY